MPRLLDGPSILPLGYQANGAIALTNVITLCVLLRSRDLGLADAERVLEARRRGAGA